MMVSSRQRLRVGPIFPPDLLKKNQGFTLIEVIITLGILIILSMALTSLLRSSLDMREGLAQASRVTNRMNTVLQTVSADLKHSFMVADDDLFRYGEPRTRQMKPYFRVGVEKDSSTLWLTTFNHRNYIKNSSESDLSLVVYTLKEAPNYPGRTHLYRGSFPRIPEDFKEEPKMEVLAQFIKSFKVTPWTGDEWSRDQWDSDKREYRNKLPHLVKIEVEAYSVDPNPGLTADATLEATESINTVVFIPMAVTFPELKQRSSSVQWGRF